MGGASSAFTEQELEDYQELTYFTKKEILHVHRRFAQLDPETVSKDKNAKLPKDKVLELQELKVNPFKDRICEVFSSSNDGDLTFEDFLDMMSVFSDNAPKTVKVEFAFKIYDFDGDDVLGRSDLEELIRRLTVVSDDAALELEQEEVNFLIEHEIAALGIRTKNFDEDDMISSDDLKKVINRLTGQLDENEESGQALSDDDMNQLIDNIYNEADLDNDKSLSFAEFEHVITKAPDFVNSFRIRL